MTRVVHRHRWRAHFTFPGVLPLGLLGLRVVLVAGSGLQHAAGAHLLGLLDRLPYPGFVPPRDADRWDLWLCMADSFGEFL